MDRQNKCAGDTQDAPVFSLPAQEYSPLHGYISIRIDLEEEEPQLLFVEWLRSFLSCGKQIELILGVDGMVHLKEHAQFSNIEFLFENEHILALITREHMWTQRILKLKNPKKGFLRLRSGAFSERDLPLVMRSEDRDVRAWQDSTGRRFRTLQTYIESKDFPSRICAMYNEPIHPLFSLDRMLHFNTAPLLDGLALLSTIRSER